MTFVGAFRSGATSILAGALMRRPAPRQHIHKVTVRTTDTRNVAMLVEALRRESDRSARLQAEVDELRAQLALADQALGLD